MKTISYALLALLALFPVACSEADGAELFTSDQAKDLAHEFSRYVQDGEFDKAADLCQMPFLYRGRPWENKIGERLKERQAEIMDGLNKASELEILSSHDLRKGKWPRKRVVPDEEREDKIRELGLNDDGYLVRAYEGNHEGVLFVLNPKPDATGLMVAGIHP